MVGIYRWIDAVLVDVDSIESIIWESNEDNQRGWRFHVDLPESCPVSLIGWWKQTSFGLIDAILIENSSKSWIIYDLINQILSVWFKISMEMGQIGVIVAEFA